LVHNRASLICIPAPCYSSGLGFLAHPCQWMIAATPHSFLITICLTSNALCTTCARYAPSDTPRSQAKITPNDHMKTSVSASQPMQRSCAQNIRDRIKENTSYTPVWAQKTENQEPNRTNRNRTNRNRNIRFQVRFQIPRNRNYYG